MATNVLGFIRRLSFTGCRVKCRTEVRTAAKQKVSFVSLICSCTILKQVFCLDYFGKTSLSNRIEVIQLSKFHQFPIEDYSIELSHEKTNAEYCTVISVGTHRLCLVEEIGKYSFMGSTNISGPRKSGAAFEAC